MLTVIVGTIFEYIAGLAVESLTDGFEGGEAYGFGLARLEYREVGGSDTHPLGVAYAGYDVSLHSEIDSMLLVIGLGLLMVSQLFAVGQKMKEENDLTI